MKTELTSAEAVMVKAALDTAGGAIMRALAILENGAPRREPCGGCCGQDFGDCPGCREAPGGHVYGGGADA